MSKFNDEAFNKEAVHPGTLVIKGGGGSLKIFNPTTSPRYPDLEIGTWWNGADGEWTPEYLTVTLDRQDMTELRDFLNERLGEQYK